MNSHQCYQYVRGKLTINMIQEFLIVTAFLSVSSAYSNSGYRSHSNDEYPKIPNKSEDLSTDQHLLNNKFEEVYRWKQMLFVPLDNGRCLFNRIVLCSIDY